MKYKSSVLICSKSKNSKTLIRSVWIAIGTGGLVGVYLFQDYLSFYQVLFLGELPQALNYTHALQPVEPLPFIVNKLGRYLLNDLLSIALIYGLFYNTAYLRFAFWVLLFGLIILLPLYLAIYIHQPQGYSSMISHLHRLVLNPVLMMLLIPAFYLQGLKEKERSPKP